MLEALFTATSAVCVTGLIVVDTPSHWCTFGDGPPAPRQIRRQAVTIALLGVALVAVSTFILLTISPHQLDAVLFEVASRSGP